jgi:hypothetical protein
MKPIPLTNAVWQQFASWHMQPPGRGRGIFVGSDDGARVLAGILYSETERGVILFQNAAVNQEQPEDERQAALAFLGRLVSGYCVTRGGLGIVLGPQVPGLQPVPAGMVLPTRSAPPRAPAPPPEATEEAEEPEPQGEATEPAVEQSAEDDDLVAQLAARAKEKRKRKAR